MPCAPSPSPATQGERGQSGLSRAGALHPDGGDGDEQHADRHDDEEHHGPGPHLVGSEIPQPRQVEAAECIGDEDGRGPREPHRSGERAQHDGPETRQDGARTLPRAGP